MILAGCYSSYARSSQHDAGAPDVEDPAAEPDAEVACTIRETGGRVLTGIDTPSSQHHHYDFTWIGGEYAVVWDDAFEEGAPSQVYYSSMTTDGEFFGDTTLPSDEGHESTALNPRLAWTGSLVGITWETYYPPQVIRFRPLRPSTGAPAGPSMNVSAEAPGHVWGIQSVMAWTDTFFAVAWPYEITGPNAEGIAVAVLEDRGSPIGIPHAFSEGYTGHPDVQADAGLAALLWTGESNYLTRLGSDGDVVSQNVVMSDEAIGRHLACGPHGKAVVWSLDGFFFMTLDAEGEPSMPPLRLADTNAAIHSAEIVWTAWGWAVAWQERWTHPEGLPSPLRILILWWDTSTVYEDEIVQIASEGVSEPHLAWTGSELALMWNHRDAADDPAPSLVFTKFTCD